MRIQTKLIFRNMKRSAKDYGVYLMTMTVVAALMYAFLHLLSDTQKVPSDLGEIMGIMIILATFFIVLVVEWLIHYMVRFLLEKRSVEFGIYLLLGMKKKEVARLYVRENLLLGMGCLGIGCVAGILLQQILESILAAMLHITYTLDLRPDGNTFGTTVLCYGSCYALALLRCRKKFKAMQIRDLVQQPHKNEEIREGRESQKKWLFPLSIACLIILSQVFTSLSDSGEIALFLVGLVAAIYLFYEGLAAWITVYIRRKGRGIYKGQRLFALRQFSAKVRTMQVTMGTLTALFTLALLGASIALLFSDYQNTALKERFPFDVIVKSAQTTDDFSAELQILEKETAVKETWRYYIYTDQKQQANAYMLKHLSAWGTTYYKTDGTPDTKKIKATLSGDAVYCKYDTYMGLSDYNHLRKLLNQPEVSLTETQYLVQIKERLKKEVDGIGGELNIAGADGTTMLSCKGMVTEPFAQDGHNGCDYLLVVPDAVLKRMEPYYAVLAVSLRENAPDGLQDQLDELPKRESVNGTDAIGSDTVIVYEDDRIVRDNVVQMLQWGLTAISLPLFYVGLVFLCVAVTVMSVQQISDSIRYPFRYTVLKQLGMNSGQIRHLIVTQLFCYDLCPALLAILISGKLFSAVGRRFVETNGIHRFWGSYFACAVLLFLCIYLVYFVWTCVCYLRNLSGKEVLER